MIEGAQGQIPRFIAELQFGPHCFINGHPCCWVTIDFLLRCIHAVCILIDCQAVYLLLYREVFELSKVIRVVLMKHGNRSAVASNVNAFESRVVFHHVGALCQRQESYGLMLLKIEDCHQFFSFAG